MKRKGKRTVWLILLSVCAIVVVGFWWRHAHDPQSDNSELTTSEVIRRDFNSTVLAVGEVKPQVGAEVRVGSRISGRVERLLANIGDVVEKG